MKARAGCTEKKTRTRADGLPPISNEKRDTFVTIHEHGTLRGIRWILFPGSALGQAVVDYAIDACFGDPRFPGVSSVELKIIEMEVTILTLPEACHAPIASVR